MHRQNVDQPSHRPFVSLSPLEQRGSSTPIPHRFSNPQPTTFNKPTIYHQSLSHPTSQSGRTNSVPQPRPLGYAFLQEHVIVSVFSWLPEIEDLSSVLLTCKSWCHLFYEQNTWVTLCTLRIPDIQPVDVQVYQGEWRHLYVHLLKSDYYYLPEMYTHIYFARRRKQAYINSRFVVVHFPNGDLIQFVVSLKATVSQILDIITHTIGLEHLTSAYSLQKREGDFAKVQWLRRDSTLDEQHVEDRHILRFAQQFFLSGGQFDNAHACLLYPQICDYILSGYYLCTREEAITFAALQMAAAHGKHAEARQTNIVKSTLPQRFHSDPDAGLDVLTAYQEILEKNPLLTRIEAKFRYLQIAKRLRTFGASIFTLNNSALTCAVCPGIMYIMKSATGHVLDQWKLERVQLFEVKDGKVIIKFGKYHKLVEIIPSPSDLNEVHESMLQYAKFIGDCKQGKVSLKLLLQISYGPNKEKKFFMNTNTSQKVDVLVKAVESRLGYKRNPQWGLLTTHGEWLNPTDFVGKYDLEHLNSGLEYRPRRSPAIIQLADSSILVTFIDYSSHVDQILNEIAETLDITPTGLGLGRGTSLLSFYEVLSQQGVSPSSTLPFSCIHCVLPSHDSTNEISLDLGYARAKSVVHTAKIPNLSPQDIRELLELELAIDSGSCRPLARLPSLTRYLTILSKEMNFMVYKKDQPAELIISEECIRVKEGITGGILSTWPLDSLAEYTILDEGILLTVGPTKEDIHFKTMEAFEIHKCIGAVIDMVLWKKDRTRHKKKMLPMHDPEHEMTIREARYRVEQITNQLKSGELEYLDLSWSAIKGNDIHRICNLLAVDQCVKHINMSGYGYGTNEILLVLETVKSSLLVENLNLTYCGLDDQVAVVIGDFLKVNKSVKYLNLSLNPFTRGGIAYLLQGLQGNITVRTVSVQLPDLVMAQEVPYWFQRPYQLKELERVLGNEGNNTRKIKK